VRVAIDTNVLVYAEFEPESVKGIRAKSIISRAARDAVIPIQVFGEFFRYTQRRNPALIGAVAHQITAYQSLSLNPVTTKEVLAWAAEMVRVHGLQFWDCVILIASRQEGARALLTEDMQDGRMIDGIRIINPFLASNDRLLEEMIGS
jgi:predicted nucleic acid-binding protein